MMTQQCLPLITIITVCYNAFNVIEETIQNVLNLSYSNIEYIIIDGGSDDGTINIIKKYEDRLKCWLSEPDKGIYDAMNKGWALADDRSFILYLGAGDKVISMPEKESFDNADVVYGDVEIGTKHLYKSKHDFMLRLGNTIHHQAELVRKKININPPFVLRYKIYSDFDFNQQLLLIGARFKKDKSFRSFALEDGVSFKFNKTEPLAIVKNNFGKMYYFFARLYYFYKNGKM
jgi:glycosyltransferase involved in cell wall biosynthesis